MSTMNEECNKYITLLKKIYPKLSQEMRAIARESFNEGWIQCERANPIIAPAPKQEEG